MPEIDINNPDVCDAARAILAALRSNDETELRRVLLLLLLAATA